jgi:hypothetical protein
MGAWGYKNFENDTAEDWYSNLVNNKEAEMIFSYLSIISEENEFIDDEESYISLAILEALAGKLNLINTIHILPDIEGINDIFLVEFSIIISKKILFFKGHSELRELWKESDEYTFWFEHQIALIQKLEEFYESFQFLHQLNIDLEIENDYQYYILNKM